MKRLTNILVLMVVGVFLMVGNAMALSFDHNITIYDGRGNLSDGVGVGSEDQETEPGMVNNQKWDLEAFFWNGSELTMVGGYNFAAGYGGTTAGDIFIDVGSNGSYDYVFDMDYAGNSYEVFGIDGETKLGKCSVPANTPASYPFNYLGDGISTGYTGSIANGLYTTGIFTDPNDVGGLIGGTHYAVGVDLSFLQGKTFTAHATLSCGNDNLMGNVAPVPEPATMLLFGTGLVGLAGFRKKFRK